MAAATRASAIGRWVSGLALALAAALTLGQEARAQGVDAIIARAVRAKGGVERIKAVQGLTMHGTIKANGLDVPVTITTLRPHYFRQEVTVQEVKVVQAFDGERAWVLNPLASPSAQPLPDEQARRMRDRADFDGPLVDAAQKGITIAFDKIERIEGRSANCLLVSRATGPVQRLCLDADTGLEIRSSVELEDEGRKARIDTMFGDYRPVDGLMLPFRVRTLVDGSPQSQLVLDRVEVSPEVDLSQFTMP